MAGESVTEQMKGLKMDEKKNSKDGGKKKNKNAGGDAGGRAELNPLPQYIDERLSVYNQLKAEHDALLSEKAAKDSKPIKITLPDGKVVDGESWKTTPYQVACGISQGLADNTVISKVNNVVWDLDRPLEEDCSLVFLKFDDEEAQAVYWHSSAHIMGEAMERVYGGCLCYGPPIENGFYYDMFLENEGVSSNDFPCLENLCKKIIKEKQSFERLEVKKETLLEMFKYNKFKCRILNEKVTTPTTTVYRIATLQTPYDLLFKLTFVSHDGDDKKRPVIIHRAILGSVERMIAILTENYGGKWPLWLSPRQVMVVPVGPTCDEYAQRVQQDFHRGGLMTDVDLDPGCTLNKKIRNAQLSQYNFILVVGEKEKSSDTVNVRTRDNKVHGERSLTDCMERLKELKASRTCNAEEDF
ncbi:threonine--tRNA ligase, cytoplasmic-like [Sinocyclocheilus grahami]|uniref:threonine--tRNA ligase, cytoplasmic-like n=1 Tax=Sinocyclocheilus grahami TaxID=75366 RepID=UPI0007AC861F|nr:PREDICTED: threonine--tRNA ligase, cytoplasmic-like [Sinocyclocheilus grahami]